MVEASVSELTAVSFHRAAVETSQAHAVYSIVFQQIGAGTNCAGTWRMSIKRVWNRYVSRRRVALAYDMAREIARYTRQGARVLDIGCGSGFIAYHLGAMLHGPVQGTDVGPTTLAPIPYSRFSGRQLPFSDQTFDVVLFCYVLHHAQDAEVLLAEARRVLSPSGRVVIYEDTPRALLDRFFCWRHERQWVNRTGLCTFRPDAQWKQLFSTLGFRLLSSRALSRFRDLLHPVSRSFYVLGKS